jgi:predicted DNA-binding transcriptional regulator YafY
MGNFLIIERLKWFDHQIRCNRYPNASTLSDRFEISSKTAQRTITFMRDRYDAPMEYHACRRGYYYTDNSFVFPNLVATQDEILAVMIAGNLLSASQDGLIGPGIGRFSRRFLANAAFCGLVPDRIHESFSADWNGYAPVNPEIFHAVVHALIETRLLSFAYQSPGKNEASTRVVEPHHLQYYMANWILAAWCRQRNDWRKFVLSRMTSASVTDTLFLRRPGDTWRHLLKGAFGIFQGGDPVDVTLRFTPFMARWIREQAWHPAQRMAFLSDGSLELSFPVADFREVKMKILQFGADVAVIQPESLRLEIVAEIVRMNSVYA